MLFACLSAPTGRRHRAGRRAAVLDALPADWSSGSSGRAGCSPAATTTRSGHRWPRRSAPTTAAPSSATAAPTRIEFAWQPDGGLRTRQRRSAVVRHPVTGRRCWFNQIAFLNEWTMDPEVREYLVDVYGADGLPFNTRFGDGDPIGEDVVELLNEVYEAHTVREPWQAGDLCSSTTSAPRTAGSRTRGRARCSSAWPTRSPASRRPEVAAMTAAAIAPLVRADHRRRRVRGDLRRPGPAGAAGARAADRGAGRGHLPAARRRRLGEPAVVLPALPRPPVVAHHRAARLDRRSTRGSTA